MKKLYTYLILLSISICTSCVEDIAPDFEFEEQVFISGLFANDQGFVSVQIQKTVPVTDTSFSAVNDAQVSLFTRDASNTISLVSDSFTVDNGNYTTSEMITPIIGNTYWIEIMLQDQTTLQSEEELLKPPIPILSMERINNTVRVTFRDQIDEQNFYLIRAETLTDQMVISDNLFVVNDTAINEDLEEVFDIGNVVFTSAVRVSIYNINFTTFQFYSNILIDNDDLSLSTLFLPTNIVGNITNTTTNSLVLGNFGVAGFSTMTLDF